MNDIDQMPFSDVMFLFDYWNKKCPPLNEAFAAYVGFKPEKDKAELNSIEMGLLAGVKDGRPWDSIPAEIREALKRAERNNQTDA